MKILFLSPNYRKRVNWGHQLFRDAVIKSTHLHDGAVQYGEGCQYHGRTHVPDIFSEIGEFDVVVLENQKNMQKYTGLEQLDCLKVIYLGDYLRDGRGNIKAYNRLINTHQVSLAFCPVPAVYRIAREEQNMGHIRHQCSFEILPYSVDTEVFKPRPELPVEYDVMAVFGLVSYIYPNRPAVQNFLKEMGGIRVLVGDWSSKIRWMDYAKAISQSKIFVSVNGIHNQITMKYTEAMASGALLLTNEPEDFGWLGYVPKYNCATFSTLRELEAKIKYYLQNEEERQIIANRGREFVIKNYSTITMAEKFIKRIKDETEVTGDSKQASGIGRSLNRVGSA